MELLYNPDRMPEEEIKATFVAREQLVDELVALVEGQPDGAGVQHVVIIAPRGMGKTTVLLMVKFAIKDRGLADRWQAVKFPEESYGVYDLADFWVETLNLIAADTADTELRQLADSLKTKYPKSDELQEAAYAALKDWRRKHCKRLLLLVENFDLILEQINDERDNARLRDVLMNDDTVMILGGATTFFKEARAYDQPLYNFFKIYNLADLKIAQMEELLRRRAELDRLADFEIKLKQNTSRLRALEYFTGGNPRLVLMLYRVVSHSDVTDVRRALEKLLDEVTPYYKAKVETLPPQQRKILDHIARISGKMPYEGLTPTEIAGAVRLTPNQVSAQLKRLSELGYVRAANLRGRSTWYTLSEPLYAIWHQMRFGRDAREKMQWLVNCLKVLYTTNEIGSESDRLDRHFRAEMTANHLREARDLLEHHRYLTEAISDESVRMRALERVIRGHLELKDAATVKGDLLIGVNLADLTDETLDALLAADCISDEQVAQVKASKSASVSAPEDKEFAETMAAASLAYDEERYEEERYEEALQWLGRALQLKPRDHHAWMSQADLLNDLGRYEEALASYDRALEIKPDNQAAWFNRGNTLWNMGQKEKAAVASCDKALGIEPDGDVDWYNQPNVPDHLILYEEAVMSYDRALEIKPDNDKAWFNRGYMLDKLGRYETAVASYDRALEIKPDDDAAWHNRGNALVNLGRYEEAVASYDETLKLKPDDDAAWNIRGAALWDLGRHEEAVLSFDWALEIKPDDDAAWHNRGNALVNLGRYEEAVASYDRALEIKPDKDKAWLNRSNALWNLGRYEEAVASYDRALEIEPDDDTAWLNRGSALGNLGRHEEAVLSFYRALQIKPDNDVAWFYRGIVCLKWFAELAQQEKFDTAREKWNEALTSGGKSNNEDWPEEVMEALLEVAKTGHRGFARQLIAEAEMKERLFPLVRAIDYLQTGDEALIEKLSPEVRGIVEKVVAKLWVY